MCLILDFRYYDVVLIIAIARYQLLNNTNYYSTMRFGLLVIQCRQWLKYWCYNNINIIMVHFLILGAVRCFFSVFLLVSKLYQHHKGALNMINNYSYHPFETGNEDWFLCVLRALIWLYRHTRKCRNSFIYISYLEITMVPISIIVPFEYCTMTQVLVL